jgi:multidrug efflux system outer membrane protein
MSPRASTTLTAALLLSGCALIDPPEERPRVARPSLPEAFLEGDLSDPGTPSPGGDPTPVSTRWWSDFGDVQLEALVERALENNLDLAIALERVAQAAAQAELVGADRRPRIGAGLAATRQRQVLVGIPIPGASGPLAPTYTSLGLNLEVAWELDLWGRLEASARAGELDHLAAGLDLAAARISLAGQVARSYLAAVEAEAQHALALDGIATRRRSLELVEERFAAGLAARLEVDQARAELASAEALAHARRRAVEGTRRQLELLLGDYPGAALEVGATLPAPPAAVPGGLPVELLARRPDLLSIETRAAAAEARLGAARSERYPRLSLTTSGGTVSDQLSDLLDGDFRVWSIGGSLVQPIFEGGRIRAGIALADAAAAELAATHANAVLRAAAEVEAALDSERELAEQVRHTQIAHEAALSVETQVEDRYRAGLASLLDVLFARRTRLDAASALLEARRARLENRVDLYLALGGGFDRQGANDDTRDVEEEPRG